MLVFALIVVISFNKGLYNPFATNDISRLAHDVDVAVKSNDPLYEEIVNKSSSLEESPQNAYIDRVWKKTPGRNGIRVDVEASYAQMHEKTVFDKSLLVYEQIPPEVAFKDLPAAPVYRGHPDKNMVSILINVSWGKEHIPDILRTLKKHRVQATFFIEGQWAKKNVDYVEMIDEQGHLIGNHAYSHPNMELLSKAKIVEEIQQTNDVLKAITDTQPKWFAPPSGSYNDHVVNVVHNMNMETVLWTVDTIDWKNPTPSVMMDRVMSKLHKGATILMHPTPVIAEALDSMIAQIKEQGYNIGTIEQLVDEKR